MNTYDERAPLLQFPGAWTNEQTNVSSVDLSNSYRQFCHLVGNRPYDWPKDKKFVPPPDSLYARATRHRKMQSYTYTFAAALTNTLLLSQVVLGAAVTGLGASNSSHILITVFGAMNTVIAGLVAFMKSRAQPMRARLFRDDLERIIDEIENSATMWLGISRGIHGYDAIDTDSAVTVRSEVARLTRLYDRAVKTNTLNDPDAYGNGTGLDAHVVAKLKDSGAGAAPAAPIPAAIPEATPAAAAAPADVDESPATKAKPPQDPDKTAAAIPTPPAPAPESPSEDPPAESSPAPAPAPSAPAAPANPAEPAEPATPSAPAAPEKPAAPETPAVPAAPPAAPADPATPPAPVAAPTPPPTTYPEDESPATAAVVHKKSSSVTSTTGNTGGKHSETTD